MSEEAIAFRLRLDACSFERSGEPAVGHYEETNSAGWDLGEDIHAAVAALTGNADPEQVNPDLPGYWVGFPPPAG